MYIEFFGCIAESAASLPAVRKVKVVEGVGISGDQQDDFYDDDYHDDSDDDDDDDDDDDSDHDDDND